MNVKLLDATPSPLSLLYSAYRQCYSPRFAGDLIEEATDEEKASFIKKVLSKGHESPLEHVKFTFAIEGVSRVLTHQLVRHRIASYSQQSQRFVRQGNFQYIIPPSIEEDEELKREFLQLMDRIQEVYDRMVEKLSEKYGEGRAKEDARFVLPQAVETKIVVTMNARELLHFFRERCCSRAQWEIRELANRMLEICREHLPAVFDSAGPKCVALGYCPEGENSCGRYPTKK